MSDLRQSLEPLRGDDYEAGSDAYRAPVQLGRIKREFRVWLDEQLESPDPGEDVSALEDRLNAALGDAGLLCPENVAGAGVICVPTGQRDFTAHGYLQKVDLRLESDGRFLTVISGVGVDCGYDQSAYLYERSGTGWARRWQSEQSNDPPAHYAPQNLHDIMISAPAADGFRLLLTLGSAPWCQSTWRPVFYRLWRIGPDGDAPELLLDRTEQAWLSDNPPIRARLEPDDVLVQFDVANVETPSTRTVFRHYRVDGAWAVRVPPIALTADGFVAEWVTADWSESTGWTSSSVLEAAEAAHARLWEQVGRLELMGWKQCNVDGRTWQVALAGGAADGRHATDYFRLWHRPLGEWRVIGLAAQPWPDCTESHWGGDDEPRAAAGPIVDSLYGLSAKISADVPFCQPRTNLAGYAAADPGRRYTLFLTPSNFCDEDRVARPYGRIWLSYRTNYPWRQDVDRNVPTRLVAFHDSEPEPDCLGTDVQEPPEGLMLFGVRAAGCQWEHAGQIIIGLAALIEAPRWADSPVGPLPPIAVDVHLLTATSRFSEDLKTFRTFLADLKLCDPPGATRSVPTPACPESGAP